MFTVKIIPMRPSVHGPFDLLVTVKGTVMTINGEEWDFSFMPPGSSLPETALDSSIIFSGVDCDDQGTLHLSLVAPADYGDNLDPYMVKNLDDGVVCDVKKKPVLPITQFATPPTQAQPESDPDADAATETEEAPNAQD